MPLSMVIALAGALSSGVLWVGKLSFANDQTSRDVQTLAAQMKELQTSVMVDLRDQAASLQEMKAQNITIDANIRLLSERVDRMLKAENSDRRR